MFCTSMVRPETIKNARAAFASSRERQVKTEILANL